jgi:hypothetical protein
LALSGSLDLDYWQELDPVDPNEDWYGLGMDLYDTISSNPEVNSAHNRLEHFLDNLEMKFLHIMHGLCKKDTRVMPKIDNRLATSLQKLSEEPDWTLVQLDKMGQWIPVRIIDYIAGMEIHLRPYCNEIDRLQLDQMYKDTTTIVDMIEDYCSNGEANFPRSWVKQRKYPWFASPPKTISHFIQIDVTLPISLSQHTTSHSV